MGLNYLKIEQKILVFNLSLIKKIHMILYMFQYCWNKNREPLITIFSRY